MIEVERNDLEKLVQMAEMYSVHLYIEGSEQLEEDALIKKIRFLLKKEKKDESNSNAR